MVLSVLFLGVGMPPNGWCPVTGSLPGILAGKHLWVATAVPHWELTTLPKHVWPVNAKEFHITGCRLVSERACTACGHTQWWSISAQNFN